MAYGFRPVKNAYGGVVRPNSFASYTIASGYGTGLFRGDPVALTTDGSIILAAPGSNTRNVGVFWGVKYVESDGEVKYSKTWPASTTATNIEADVIDDPTTVFMVEADQVGTAMTEAFRGASGDATSGTGDSATGISGWYLDSSGTWGATAAQLKILGSAEQGERNVWTAAGTAMDVFVVFNEHVWHGGTAGVATS